MPVYERLGAGHVIRVDDTSDATQSMEFVAVIVHVLRGAIAPRRSMFDIIFPYLASASAGVLTDFNRFGINAEHELSAIYCFCHGLTNVFPKLHGFHASLIILTTSDQIGNGFWALRIQPLKKIIVTIDAECLCGDGECNHL